MTIDAARFQKLLGEFKLEQLFNELGWERASLGPQNISANSESFTLTQMAHKRGVAVFRCSPDATGNIPSRAVLLKIEKEAAKIAHEHLLVFADVAQKTLTWLWVSRIPGQPTATRTHTWHKGQSGESLRQKLTQIVWSLEEEEAITLTDVITGLSKAFDRDRISKSFYDKFKSQHDAFADFIEGLTSVADKTWYASLMLNRLMFVYFIQKKGFLDKSETYLGDRLAQVQAAAGKGKFHSFYRQFLRRLFHEGLGQAKGERNAELTRLIGDVPYLNGGLFSLHELEEANPGIDVPDEAFERLFAFFDAWDWHLDDRPLSTGNEINPDVLGYIFEKYINQKQMGAYYTKEDITEYISKNTVIPHLLEQARERCKVAFEGESTVWYLLKADPDRYIYPAMKTGVIDASGAIVPESALPDFVQTGMKDAKARMFERRYNLSEAVFTTATGERATLPTETWREYVDRRQRCLAVRDKLASGEVKSADDLITLNLDIRQFMQDVIDTCTSPDLLRAVWQAIVGRVPERSAEKFRHGITILDPTCGSGAFLFAALSVLEPLYEACLDRMEGFVEDARKLGKPCETDFTKALAEVDKHPSRRYYIYKNIILHNLFGVDIMAEAVEICKLRLFLKLVSQVNADHDLEPLPDIDFNIRTGNTLVGYATEAQFDAANTLASDQAHRDEIKASTADLADLFDRFREQQTVHGGKVTPDDKRRLRDKLSSLSLELDKYLAHEYGIDPTKPKAFAAWRESHQPFHWFAEFYGVMRDGGFDVVIGNPPYVEYAKIKSKYLVKHYETEDSGNLYAFVVEICRRIHREDGYIGMILPVSSLCTDRTESVQRIFFQYQDLWGASFDLFPARLFEGAAQRLAIVVGHKKAKNTSFIMSSYMRWMAIERPALFQTLSLQDVANYAVPTWIPRLGKRIELNILSKLHGDTISAHVDNTNGQIIYVHRIVNNYVKAVSFPPYFKRQGEPVGVSADFKNIKVTTKSFLAIQAILNSSLFYWYWRAHGDGFHCGLKDIRRFPLRLAKISDSVAKDLSAQATKLNDDLNKNSEIRVRNQVATGRVELQTFFVGISMPILNQIDIVLARHYGLSQEELDFIINYDIKYRMGGTDDEE